ncbi:hypothetical protein J6590_039200 [Homalodisca vitripennis]|nr:hypothetical protein J6590_039200 [Homalodisca vitripennis]
MLTRPGKKVQQTHIATPMTQGCARMTHLSVLAGVRAGDQVCLLVACGPEPEQLHGIRVAPHVASHCLSSLYTAL